MCGIRTVVTRLQACVSPRLLLQRGPHSRTRDASSQCPSQRRPLPLIHGLPPPPDSYSSGIYRQPTLLLQLCVDLMFFVKPMHALVVGCRDSGRALRLGLPHSSGRAGTDRLSAQRGSPSGRAAAPKRPRRSLCSAACATSTSARCTRRWSPCRERRAHDGRRCRRVGRHRVDETWSDSCGRGTCGERRRRPSGPRLT